jgi:hypothetical protein
VPGIGACAGQFTASTMAIAAECLGIAAIGDGLIPADETDAKLAAVDRAAHLAIALAEDGTTARRFLNRRALLNAMAGIAATGGSTNGLLHLLAIAREAGVRLTLDDLAGRRRAHTRHRQPRARRPLGRRGPASDGRALPPCWPSSCGPGTSTATRRQSLAAPSAPPSPTPPNPTARSSFPLTAR